MATPIQYTKQFIPSNIGLMNQQLGQMQQVHDQAAGSINQFEDQYAQMMVDPSDIEGKNAILGGFQNKIKSIVDRYGGDFGAASKDIARELSKSKNDPFFQLAPYKRALAEEQRKQINQLGPNAIVARDISNTPIYNPETGQYASKEDLSSRVLDKRAFQQQLEEGFGKLGSQVRDTKLTRNKEFGHLLDETSYKGIYQREIPEKAAEMKQLLMQDPDMPEAIADEMANNYATQLSQGWQTSHIQDPLYIDEQKSKRSGRDDYSFLNNMTTKLTDRVGANLSTDYKNKVLDKIDKNSDSVENYHAVESRTKFLKKNPDVIESLSGALTWDDKSKKYINKYNNEDLKYGDIDQMISDRKSGLERQLKTAERALMYTGADPKDPAIKINKDLVDKTKSELKKIIVSENKLKSDISSYYDTSTGDYNLPVYGFNESLDGAIASGMKPSEYNTQINAVKSNVKSTLDKYTIGEDLIIESGDYDEEFQRDVAEAQAAGKDLSGEKKVFASLKKQGGMDFVGVVGNSYTGIKFIVKDGSGNQHIVKATTPVVRDNILNSLNMPELKEMDNYKDEVRNLIPDTKLKGTNLYYGNIENQPFLYKQNSSGVKSPVTYSDYVDALDKLNLTSDQEDAVVSQLNKMLKSNGSTMDDVYSPGENNQYKLIKLAKLLK